MENLTKFAKLPGVKNGGRFLAHFSENFFRAVFKFKQKNFQKKERTHLGHLSNTSRETENSAGTFEKH